MFLWRGCWLASERKGLAAKGWLGVLVLVLVVHCSNVWFGLASVIVEFAFASIMFLLSCEFALCFVGLRPQYRTVGDLLPRLVCCLHWLLSSFRINEKEAKHHQKLENENSTV